MLEAMQEAVVDIIQKTEPKEALRIFTQDQELYTGSNDKQILVWSPSNPVIAEMEEDVKKGWLSGSRLG